MKNHRPTPPPPASPSRDVLDADIIGLLAAGQQMDRTTDAAADAKLAGKLQRTLMQRRSVRDPRTCRRRRRVSLADVRQP